MDDNVFGVELGLIEENSFNIHQEGARLVFREEENPQAKLMATARNDRLFEGGADHERLAKETRYVLAGTDDVARNFRVIVLPQTWMTTPWNGVDEADQPDRWNDERLPIIVIPDDPDRLDERLGQWLKDHLQKRRNTVRFLLPRNGSQSAYLDRNLIVLARAVLKAQEWRSQSPEYERLHRKYQAELRGVIKQRFDRFAILQLWNFSSPAQCRFHVEALRALGEKIPEAIEQRVQSDLFVPEDFEALVLLAANNNESLGKLLRDLQEPRPNGEPCIPWLGETSMKEKVLRVVTRGRIAINLRGMEFLQLNPGEDEETAWKRLRGRLGTGRQLEETYILLPQAVPAAHGATPTPPPLFTPTTPDPTPARPPVTVPVPPPSTLFPAQPLPRQSLTAPPTSALNLLGRVEGWGVGPGTTVHDVKITLSTVTGAQLQKLLRTLPDGLTYELSLEKEQI